MARNIQYESALDYFVYNDQINQFLCIYKKLGLDVSHTFGIYNTPHIIVS
jgi:hypothetical protein